MSNHRALFDLAETMFATDERVRLTGHAPHFHLLRTPELVICRCHEDFAEEVATALQGLSRRLRGRPSQWAREYADYLRVLSSVAPLRAVRAGPLYSFPNLPFSTGKAVSIDHNNADLLLGGLDEWVPDAAMGLPMIAMVVDGRAVSVCASVNASGTADCAGVETLPAYRGRGLDAQAVASWARTVQVRGASPYYGTTFDNIASQGVAGRLGLNLIGSEFTVECETG